MKCSLEISLAAAACLWLTGCTIDQTTCVPEGAGCRDGVNIEFRGLASDQLYDVTLTTPDGATACAVEAGAISCDESASYFSSSSPILVGIASNPETIVVVIQQGEVVVFDTTFAPEYFAISNNLEKCGIECEQANILVDISASSQ